MLFLKTKLHLPSASPGTLVRPRLLDQLEESVAKDFRLALLVAPPGSGKTTLLASWIAARHHLVAWFSLDENDNRLSQFLFYLMQGLSPLLGQPQIINRLLEVIEAEHEPPTELVLTSLINALSETEQRVVLVLDDFHLIEDKKVKAAVTFLLEHIPSQLFLVIVSRVEPDLPVSRLRARGQLIELRVADLRFSAEETAAVLRGSVSKELTPAQISQLQERTEGWVTGLHLLALSLNTQPDIQKFIGSFSGSHRYIADYLLDEVLNQQREELKLFLFKTSLLSSMTGGLCEAVTGQAGGQETLEKLEKANLFIIPLDDERQWYRYHHLFADLLRHRLRLTYPAELSTIYLRASLWYEQHGLSEEAVRHAIASGSIERLEQLLPAVIEAYICQNQLWLVLSWFEAMPPELLLQSYRLTLYKAWVLALSGQPEQSAQYLTDIKDHLPENLSAQDSGLLEATLAYNAWIGSGAALLEAVEHSLKALNLLDNKAKVIRNILLMLVGRVKLFLPDSFAEGLAMVQEALAQADQLNNRFVSVGSLTVLVFVLIGQGRFVEAQTLLNQITHDPHLSLQDANNKPVMTLAYALCSTIFYVTNELEKAEQELSKVIQGEPLDMLDLFNNAWAYVVKSLIYRARGRKTESLEILRRIEATKVQLPPTIRLAPFKVGLLLELGQIAEAQSWAESEKLSPTAEITPDVDDLYLAYVRLLIYQQYYSEALQVLAKLEELESRFAMSYRLVVIYVLRAIIWLKTGKVEAATESLSKAVGLAAPVNLFRAFLDEETSIAPLLVRIRPVAPHFVDVLLAAYSLPAPQPLKSPLTEPLTEREEEVLGLIALGLSNLEIGERLVLAVGTVKRHAANIFAKLEVNNRTEAVARARDLGLL